MLSNAVREGADIFFVCHVDAVPGIKEITWLHNQRPLNESSLQTGDSEGLIISNNSLVLQRVRIEQRGHYACLASNSEGISESNRLELRVLREYSTGRASSSSPPPSWPHPAHLRLTNHI